MRIFFRNTLIIGWITVIGSVGAIASEALPVKVANMAQDIALVTKELAELRLEIEMLSHENQALKKQIEKMQLSEREFKVAQSKQDAELAGLNHIVESYKKTMLIEVAEEMEKFSKQTQKAIDQLGKPVANKSSNDAFKFTDDYSKEGVVYTVKAGDSLSLIAQRQGGTVRDIQNANHIADPRELKAGQVIFIPTKK